MQEPEPLTGNKQWRYRIDIRSVQETAEANVPKLINEGVDAIQMENRFSPQGSRLVMYPADHVHPGNACWQF